MRQKEKGVVYHRGGWWARVYTNGKQHWYSCASQAQARKLYTRLKAEVLEQRFDPARYKQHLTVAQWITRCLEGCTNRDKQHQEYYGKEWSALLGSRPLSLWREGWSSVLYQGRNRIRKSQSKSVNEVMQPLPMVWICLKDQGNQPKLRVATTSLERWCRHKPPIPQDRQHSLMVQRPQHPAPL